jgi:hypothetical protein
MMINGNGQTRLTTNQQQMKPPRTETAPDAAIVVY